MWLSSHRKVNQRFVSFRFGPQGRSTFRFVSFSFGSVRFGLFRFVFNLQDAGGIQGWRLEGRGAIHEPQVWVRPLTGVRGGVAGQEQQEPASAANLREALASCCRHSTKDAGQLKSSHT